MMTGIYLKIYMGDPDSSRIAAQVISGISFLGAGTILVTKQNQVKGLTTAAGQASECQDGYSVPRGRGSLACYCARYGYRAEEYQPFLVPDEITKLRKLSREPCIN